jgi:hypothetical protein
MPVRVFSRYLAVKSQSLTAAWMTAVACDLSKILISRFLTMVAAVLVIAARRTAAAVVGTSSVVCHSYLRSLTPMIRMLGAACYFVAHEH